MPSADTDTRSFTAFVVLCSLLALVQAALVLVAGGGPTRAAGVLLAIVVCQVAAARMRPRSTFIALLIASALILVNLGAHVTAGLRGNEYRLLHVAVFGAYVCLGIGVALSIALARRLTFAIAVALVLTAAVVGLEAGLGPSSEGRPRWVGEIARHPLLDHHYPSDTAAASIYPDNPRDYFADDRGLSRWVLELHDPNSSASFDQREGLMRVSIAKASLSHAYDIQLNYPGLEVAAGMPLTLSFRARADRPRSIAFAVSMAHEPWQGLGFYREAPATPEWREFSYDFTLAASDTNARLHFDLGSDAASVDLDRVSLKRSADGTVIAPVRLEGSGTVSYRFNALGCRGPDYPVPRAPGTFRILILGDSYALGTGVHEADTIAQRLEASLNRRAGTGGAAAYEVINCGVAGYGTPQASAFYQAFGALYEPDVVLLLMNDTDAGVALDDDEAGNAGLDGYDRLFRSVRLARSAFRARWRSIDFSPSGRALSDLVRSTSGDAARLAVVLFRTGPETRAWRELGGVVSAVSKASGVPMLDLGPAMLAASAADALRVHVADGRPNEIAHRIAAVEVESFLDRTRLLTPIGTRRPLAAAEPAARDDGARPPAFLAGTRGADPAGSGRPLVIAHRGDSHHFPENTIASIESAFALGADVVEVDVYLTRDGIPVVFHDDTLERTTDGVGRVIDRTLSELKSLDAGSWKGPQFAGARVPTLEEVVRVAHARGRGLLLDLKVAGLARQVVEVYRRAGADPRDALIGAWTRAQRLEFVRRMPGALVLKTESAPANWSPELFAQMKAEGLWGFEVGDDWPPAFVGDAVRHRLPVIAYTVNDAATMRRLIDMGITGIETDDPGLLARLASRPAP